MKEEPLHPWIEPELEARIVALVLGEASDFEREELERLIEEKAELAMFKKRMQAVHGLLREVATGESLEEEKNWKLGDGKRQALLAVIDGEEKEKKKTQTPIALKTATTERVSLRPYKKNSTKKSKASALSIALIVHLGLVAVLMLYVVYSPVPDAQPFFVQSRSLSEADEISSEKVVKMQKSRSVPSSPAHRYTINEAGIASRSLSSVAPSLPPADASSAARSDSQKESRASLSSIRGNLARYSPTAEEPALIESKLKNIILPKVEFQDTPLKEALATLQEQSAEYDRQSSNPATKGVNFNLSKNANGAEDVGITMKLSNVPLVTALKYTSSFANLRYKVEPGGVIIVPLSSPDADLVTTTYKVSPSFMSVAATEREEMDAAADPFAEPEEETSTLKRRRTAKNILVEAGVAFAPGASVIYNPETSELIVRNTQDQLELVEAYKDSIKEKSEGLSFPDMNDNADAPAPVERKKHNLTRNGDTVISSLDIADDNFMDGKADKKSPYLGHGQTTPITILGKSLNVPQSAPLIASAGEGGSGTVIGQTSGTFTINPAIDKNQKTELTSRSNDARTGGNISQLSESKVTDARETTIDVSGMTTGRQVNIGGGFQGKAKAKKEIPPDTASLYASAGNGGTMSGVTRGAYSNTARNHTRAEFLKEVAVGWELPVPIRIKAGREIGPNKPAKSESDAETKAQSHGNNYAGTKNNAGALRATGSPTIKGKVGLLKKSNHPATTSPNPALNSAPKVSARSGGYTAVEQQRELIASKDYDPPEIPEEQNKQTMDKIYRRTPAVVGGGSRSGKLAKTDKIEVTAGAPITLETTKNKNADQSEPMAYSPQDLLKHHIKSAASKFIPLKKTKHASRRFSGSSIKPYTPKPIQIKKSPAPAGLNEKSAAGEAFSTFSLHVSDVSFKLAQAALAKGEWPEASKVRIEEFVNAFDYDDAMPSQDQKVACQMEQAVHPFLQQRNLLRVSMRTAAAGRAAQTPLRLTFLLDNSGSMERTDRQQTVQRAFALLAQQLQAMDQVTLISFARQPRLLADKVSGDQADQLIKIVSNIPSEGGTNLEAALQLAYEKAQEQQIDQAQNRIIMLTDGAANLGDADPDNLSRLIEKMRASGIAFDAAGIGADGLNDEILEALTRKGDGRYYLLDQPQDADEGFARQIAGALRPSAKNVKVQIEFNPKRVGKYKLLGFEKHRLKKEDFRNDKVDAAEMAAAEAGVAVYQFEAKPDGEGDVGSVSVRFRDLSSGQMIEKRWPILYRADAPRLDQAAPSIRIASTAALFAAKLKSDPLANNVDLTALSQLIGGLPDRERQNKRVQQLQQMINAARATNP